MSAPFPAIREDSQLDLITLRRLKYDELEQLYRAAKPPSALSDLNGDAVGAMLAWRTPRTGPLAWLLKTFGESSIFADRKSTRLNSSHSQISYAVFCLKKKKKKKQN